MKEFIIFLLALRKEQNLPLWHELDLCDNVHAILECDAYEVEFFHNANKHPKVRLEVHNFNYMTSKDKTALIKSAVSELVSEGKLKTENFVMLA